MNAVTAIGRAVNDLVQENNITVIFLNAHTMERHIRQFINQRCQFMIMRGKQRPTAIDFVQMLDNSPGNGQTVKCSRSSADFIQNHKRTLVRLIQNTCRFDHFNHKGRTAARQIVKGADTGKQLINNANVS